MSRDVTLFTGQWADLSLTELLPIVADMGYDGVELACWGDHFEVQKALTEEGYVEAKWQTRIENTPAGRGNYACYSNPTVDALIATGASEPDPAKRQEVYDEMQRLIQRDAPAVFLYVPQEIEAASSSVHNWEPSPDGRINLHDVWLSGGQRTSSGQPYVRQVMG